MEKGSVCSVSKSLKLYFLKSFFFSFSKHTKHYHFAIFERFSTDFWW